jgi:hypothetical protein
MPLDNDNLINVLRLSDKSSKEHLLIALGYCKLIWRHRKELRGKNGTPITERKPTRSDLHLYSTDRPLVTSADGNVERAPKRARLQTLGTGAWSKEESNQLADGIIAGEQMPALANRVPTRSTGQCARRLKAQSFNKLVIEKKLALEQIAKQNVEQEAPVQEIDEEQHEKQESPTETVAEEDTNAETAAQIPETSEKRKGAWNLEETTRLAEALRLGLQGETLTAHVQSRTLTQCQSRMKTNAFEFFLICYDTKQDEAAPESSILEINDELQPETARTVENEAITGNISDIVEETSLENTNTPQNALEPSKGVWTIDESHRLAEAIILELDPAAKAAFVRTRTETQCRNRLKTDSFSLIFATYQQNRTEGTLIDSAVSAEEPQTIDSSTTLAAPEPNEESVEEIAQESTLIITTTLDQELNEETSTNLLQSDEASRDMAPDSNTELNNSDVTIANATQILTELEITGVSSANGAPIQTPETDHDINTRRHAEFAENLAQVSQTGAWTHSESLRLAKAVSNRLNNNEIARSVRTRTVKQCLGRLRTKEFAGILENFQRENTLEESAESVAAQLRIDTTRDATDLAESGISDQAQSSMASVEEVKTDDRPCKRRKIWTDDMVDLLISGLYKHGRGNNAAIAQEIPGITPLQVSEKIRTLEENGLLPDDIPRKTNVSGSISGHWTQEEYDTILEIANTTGGLNFHTLKAGLDEKRTASTTLQAHHNTRDLPGIARLIQRLTEQGILTVNSEGIYHYTRSPLRS